MAIVLSQMKWQSHLLINHLVADIEQSALATLCLLAGCELFYGALDTVLLFFSVMSSHLLLDHLVADVEQRPSAAVCLLVVHELSHEALVLRHIALVPETQNSTSKQENRQKKLTLHPGTGGGK